MTYSPEKILNFLSSHYAPLGLLYGYAKAQNHTISLQQFAQITQAHGLEKQLLNYKIIKPNEQGGYEMALPYFQFFAFLNRDFALDLPEQLGKYRDSFERLSRRLQAEKPDHVQRVKDICSHIIDELQRFLTHLEENTNALEEAVDKLRNEQAANDDYVSRIAKATYLIETFLKPLNQILAPHPHAIVRLLQELRAYVHGQTLQLPDSYRSAAYQTLHGHLIIADRHLALHLGRLIRNLLPLLAHMRLSDRVLAGFKILRDAHVERDYKRYLPLLPALVKRRQHHVYNFYRESMAQGILSEVGETPPTTFSPEEELPNQWFFNKEVYQTALRKALPLDHFFVWCHEILKQENPEQPITSYQFLKVANLLFASELRRTFTGSHTELQLQDRSLTLPQIQLTLQT